MRASFLSRGAKALTPIFFYDAGEEGPDGTTSTAGSALRMTPGPHPCVQRATVGTGRATPAVPWRHCQHRGGARLSRLVPGMNHRRLGGVWPSGKSTPTDRRRGRREGFGRPRRRKQGAWTRRNLQPESSPSPEAEQARTRSGTGENPKLLVRLRQSPSRQRPRDSRPGRCRRRRRSRFRVSGSTATLFPHEPGICEADSSCNNW